MAKSHNLKEFEQNQIQKSVAKSQNLKRELDRMRGRYRELEGSYRELCQVMGYRNAIEVTDLEPSIIEPHKRRGDGEACAISLMSDVHPFESVIPAQVNDLNEYNPDICKASCLRYFQGVLQWLKIHRAGQNVHKLAFVLLGDIIGNMIHLDQVESNAGTPQEELLFALDILIGGINFLLDNADLKELRVVGIHGNHDRGTEKKQAQNMAKHAHTWVLYNLIKRYYEDYRPDKRVVVEIADGEFHYIDIFGQICRLHHGDLIRYQGGIGGLTVPANNRINGWNTARKADFDFFGHHHTTHWDKANRFIANGTIMGFSPISLRYKVKYEPPQQTFILMDKQRGLTSVNAIYVR